MTSIQLENIKTELLKNVDLRGDALQKRTVEVLDQQVPYYNWTGFYWMNDVKKSIGIRSLCRRSNGPHQHPLW